MKRPTQRAANRLRSTGPWPPTLSIRLQENRAQRRQREGERVHAAEAGDGGGFDAAHVALAAAAVFDGVGVHEFAPEAAAWGADAIVLARHRREVADDGDLLA